MANADKWLKKDGNVWYNQCFVAVFVRFLTQESLINFKNEKKETQVRERLFKLVVMMLPKTNLSRGYSIILNATINCQKE